MCVCGESPLSVPKVDIGAVDDNISGCGVAAMFESNGNKGEGGESDDERSGGESGLMNFEVNKEPSVDEDDLVSSKVEVDDDRVERTASAKLVVAGGVENEPSLTCLSIGHDGGPSRPSLGTSQPYILPAPSFQPLTSIPTAFPIVSSPSSIPSGSKILGCP